MVLNRETYDNLIGQSVKVIELGWPCVFELPNGDHLIVDGIHDEMDILICKKGYAELAMGKHIE